MQLPDSTGEHQAQEQFDTTRRALTFYNRTGCEFSVTPRLLAWAAVEGNSVRRERCGQKNGGTPWQRMGRECA